MNFKELPEEHPRKKIRENLNRRARIAFEKMGWEVALCQWFNPHDGRSHDLFGFADLIMFVPNSDATVLVQVCAIGDRNKRIRKLLEAPKAWHWLRGSNQRHIWIDAWRKLKRDVYDTKGRTITREVWTHDLRIITVEDFDKCLTELWARAEFPDAETNQNRDPECVPTISGSTNVSESAKAQTLRLVKSSTIQRDG